MRRATVLLLVVATLNCVRAELARSQSASDSSPAAASRVAAVSPSNRVPTGSDSQPGAAPSRAFRDAGVSGAEGADAAGDTTLVYFTPQDENTSTTALFLYNTNAVPETVSFRTFYVDGAPTLNTTIPVPALGTARVCADAVSTVSASWAGAPLVNMTTFSAYARMRLPIGVRASAYVAWDTTGTYDPLSSLEVLPIRMSRPSTKADTLTFTPQDENTSTSVLFLYNTTNALATVSIQTFAITGAITINTTVDVPANSMVRICSDQVTTIAASWAGATLVNFTTFSAYAKLGLPPGVLCEGYVAWNTSGIYDPLAVTQTLPLDFVSGAASVFTPPPAPASALGTLRAMPNPSATGTRVGFSLSQSEDAVLSVYDSGGRLVQTLVHGRLGAGNHEFAWDGRTSGGADAESGIYFVRLHTPSRDATVKIAAVK